MGSRGGRWEHSGRSRRVLIIEDNVDAAETYRMVLELSGYRVEIAFNAADGVEMAHSFIPEVVLCDIGLPGTDGFAVARSLRAEPLLKRPRLIALTGYAGPDDVERALRAGFHSHLPKPAEPEALLRLMSTPDVAPDGRGAPSTVEDTPTGAAE